MRIDRVESFGNEWVAFVRVATDDGAEGWGQVAPYNADITAEVLHRQVAPHALGQDALDPEALGDARAGGGAQVPRLVPVPRAWRARHRALGPARPARGRARVRARSARTPGRSTPTRRACGATSRPRTRRGGSPRCGSAHGFRAFKFRVGRECGHDQDEWPGPHRGRSCRPCAPRARRRRALLVDANSCYTPAAGDRGRPVPRAARRRALRGAVPVLGARVDGRGGRARSTWTSPAASRTACSRSGGGSRAAGGRRRPARRLLRGRLHPRARRRPHGRGGRPPVRAALRQPVAGHGLHPAPAGARSPTPARTWSSRSRAPTTTRGRTACTTRRSR